MLFTGLHAGVRAELSRESISLGETVILRLHVEGGDAQEPIISKLCNTKVISTSRSNNMQIINGSVTKAQVLSYSFAPTASCTIDPISVMVDAKQEQTQALSLHVKPMSITKDSPFILTMQAEKSDVYVGEPLKVTIKLKQRKNAQAVDSKFAPPELKNFWIKAQQQSKRYEEGEYHVTEITYIMAAQKSGQQHIGRAQLQIAQRTRSRDAWGQWFPQLQWRSFFTNELDINVKALPQGINLVGDFKISATLDKTQAAANDAVNLTLRIVGAGNIEDIGSLKPFIDGVNIFEEDATIQSSLKDARYQGLWQQKMAFVSQDDYTIPSIEVKYFDPQSQSVKSMKTEALHVKIKGNAPKKEETLNIERSLDEKEVAIETRVVTQESYLWVMTLVGGFILGIASMLIPWKRLKKEDDTLNTLNMRDEKSILNFLLNHIADAEVSAMVHLLEQKLYEGKSVTIDKKQLKNILKRYKVSP